MLSSVDRIQIVVWNRGEAARTWRSLFDAEVVGEGRSAFLNANRTTVQAGDSLVELLEPAGDGPVRDFAERWGSGLYGVGFSTDDLERFVRHLDSQQVRFTGEDGALYLAPAETHGMPTVIVPRVQRDPAGLLSHIYEVTNPVRDWQDTAARYTRIFGLDPTRFSPIKSTLYGYSGTLTLFDPPVRLDRVEITQTSGGGAMDRFFQKRGPSLYMCYAETPDVQALAERLKGNGARFAQAEDAPPESGLFIHPSSLDGMLMGISRTNYAWAWSGRPELAGEGAAQFTGGH
jgi:catechol 2,3-dioxygenase-like lactoylglutathione lyase family enzyme